ncbi:MAG: glycogen/starch/alpha-glucan phosphorylase [Nitrospinae bacterium]|nr:glycogen/starch/alpha-glucan phosphorylase [Nitrospinota bacterium]
MAKRKKNPAKENDAKGEVETLKDQIKNHIVSTLAKDPERSSKYDYYSAVAYATRDRLIERWIKTQNAYYQSKAKRVYYLSLEFLAGRTLGNSLINMGMMDDCHQALHELGYDLEEVREVEWDAGLGNGGLGRLAACFLDSLATLEIPSYGYGIHYEYGIFYQKITNGHQVEVPDNWLRYGNPWEFARTGHLFPVNFFGKVNQFTDANGALRNEWVDAEEVMAIAYDTPVPGYNNNHVINMRLWAARSSRDFDLNYFNQGDYIRALESKMMTETISKVLYPSDHVAEGKELRFKQQYFLVCATIQDIIRRHKKHHSNFDNFPDTVALQLNDTHPVLAIPELMRILLDKENYSWEAAWDITVRTFGYTNHTVMPEALEKWTVSLVGEILPRHLQIIYEINQRFLEQVARTFPGDVERIKRVSIIEEAKEKMVRMANLAIVGSHSVNGVSALHTELLKTGVFKDFDEIFPGRFNNKTNGITPRRWLKKCNPGLSRLITGNIGEGWVTDLDQLKKLKPLAKDKAFRAAWRQAKHANKERLAKYIMETNGIKVDPDSLFDVHVKRIHEYKRQLLNVLHVVTLYNRIKENPGGDHTPRTVIFGGKAAPSYWMAKLTIKLVNAVADIVNSDKKVSEKLKVVFLANYRVSLAEKIMPAADLSEQISTAGTEASGTGNMKFALNGALTIGTLDGANIEIMEEVGKENIFIFGLTADEVADLNKKGYNPKEFYDNIPELKKALDMIGSGYFSPFNPSLFAPVVDALVNKGDHFMLLADYASYIDCQERVSAAYRDKDRWDTMSILNTANMGKFSSDRTIKEYAREIWNVKPVHVK